MGTEDAAPRASPEAFRVTVEFCGGLEQLTEKKTKTLPLRFLPLRQPPSPACAAPDGGENAGKGQKTVKLYQLVSFLSSHVVVEKPELFAEAYEPPCRADREGEGGLVAGESREPARDTEGRNEAVFSTDLLCAPTLSPMRIKPGILALIDDVDVEVLGGMEAPVPSGSCVTFISTLHGG
ncbi:conserved hypothetical protein [Neospora caninum Liverpool]|uniref:Ubiquitin-related modifier 1 n=1 Tax=Neospora caninum (strain Liverpool) TaxID=572307 RepID=F0VIF2_NEOCL|nr:conserved hypothetical protein [Neospora caninum Liverpool]CBZ53513.1 conserved hypothetical protein [Neospora caninum Liverpool]CEL67501.1 TPA: Ubiquitin-related modifier 1 homolog [Neospora caninum Liverpool]|eukprot:XP_003883545.1 conserved hypothetical protein [Neospora caninum Liverpool]